MTYADCVNKETDSRGVCRLTLRRPDKHNALNAELIESLTTHLKVLHQDNDCRVVVITGEGASFCSGADLGWMQSMVDCDEVTNRRDAVRLADLMRSLYILDKPTVARVNGAAFGGGLGLIACCDIAVGVDSARFGFTEVRLGLVPAVISPYVVAAIGVRHAKRLFLSGEIFTPEQALQFGLLTHCATEAELDAAVEKQVERLLAGGPVAQREAKTLLHHLTGAPLDAEDYTVDLIARLRVGDEGQEGLKAFLAKRKPDWSNES